MNTLTNYIFGFVAGAGAGYCLSRLLLDRPRLRRRSRILRVIPPGAPVIRPPACTIIKCGGPCYHDSFESCDCGLFESLNPHIK